MLTPRKINPDKNTHGSYIPVVRAMAMPVNIFPVSIQAKWKAVLKISLSLLIGSFMDIRSLYAQNHKDQLSLTLDNDEYINPTHDRYYTGGTLFDFAHAVNQSKIKDTKIIKKVVEFEFGQRIYNAYKSDASHIANVPPYYTTYNQDRPFTAYLFAGTSLNWFYANESVLKFNIEIGTIGPAALGKQVQYAIHNLVGAYPPLGWRKQLNNEPGLNLRLDYKKLMYRNDSNWFDITFDPDVWLGNTFTGAYAGLQLRAGNLNKLYESAGTNSRVSSNNNEPQKHEFYFFTQPQFNYVAYDATIEGGLFIKNKGPVTFGIYHYVYEQLFGLQFASSRWSANYVVYIKSREVKSTALGDQWGSVSASYYW